MTEDDTPDWARVNLHLTEFDDDRLNGGSDCEEDDCFFEEGF